MNTYTNKNRFFGEIIDNHLQDKYVKDLSDETSADRLFSGKHIIAASLILEVEPEIAVITSSG